MNTLTSHCTNPNPCWEHFGDHNNGLRVSSRGIELAYSLLRLRVLSLPSRPSIEQLQQVQEATDLCIELNNRQWREMVREPFNFPTHRQSGGATSSPRSRTLEDIL